MTVVYEVLDIDSAGSGGFTLTVTDDAPSAASQANIDVAEGDVAIGYESSTTTSTGGAANLITGEGTPPTADGPDVAGADAARVHEITYNDKDGNSPTKLEERRGGKACVSTCRSRGAPADKKKKKEASNL